MGVSFGLLFGFVLLGCFVFVLLDLASFGVFCLFWVRVWNRKPTGGLVCSLGLRVPMDGSFRVVCMVMTLYLFEFGFRES